MPRQAIQQASCTECGEDELNHTVTDTDMGYDDDGQPFMQYDTRCTCGKEGSVVVDNAGIASVESLNHEEASWNQDEEESDDDS